MQETKNVTLLCHLKEIVLALHHFLFTLLFFTNCEIPSNATSLFPLPSIRQYPCAEKSTQFQAAKRLGEDENGKDLQNVWVSF